MSQDFQSPPPDESAQAADPTVGQAQFTELNRLRRLADAIPECIWVLDLAEKKMKYVSAAYETIWGRHVQDLLDNRLDWLRHVHPDDQARLKNARNKARQGGLDEEFRVVRPDGGVRWLHLTTIPLHNAEGHVDSIGGVASDITGFVEQRNELRVSLAEQRLQAEVQRNILDALPANIAILDANGIITEVNQSWRKFAADNAASNEAIGDNYLSVCDSVQSQSSDEAREARELADGIRAILAGGSQLVTRIYSCKSSEQQRWFRVNATPLHTETSRGAVIMHIDVTERMLAEQRLLQVVHYDSLTALPNRLLFQDRLNTALAISRHNGWSLAVCVIDIDRFKAINDSLGHQIGDQLIKEVASRLQTSVRDCDTVSRLGGDEFALILPELKDQQGSAQAAQRILNALERPFKLDGQETFITASIGISLFPDDAEDLNVLIRNADTAMYRAKEAGRNNYQFFTSEMNAHALKVMHMERDLRHAIERDEFRLHYQPKVSCGTGKIVGFEALLRLEHPQRGLVSPAEFVPLLEETGLIVPVGDWVMRTACTQTLAWQKAGLGKLTIAVNVSGKQMHGHDLCASVHNALQASGLAPEYLELELTESYLMRDAEGVITTLRSLKEMGVMLSVDDFGTGYSSLAYLKRFPLDTLKVDRAFVQDITADPGDVSITRAIITLAHSFKLKVVAEGVETEGQLGLLIANQCDEIQGYFFSRPLPPEKITAMLEEGRCLPDDLLGQQRKIQRTILLVDDEENILVALKHLLQADGYTILTATSAAQGFELLAKHRVEVIIADQRMPDMSGIEFLRRAKSLHPESVRMVLSGYTDILTMTEAINEGAIYKLLTKPWDEATLRSNVEDAFRSHTVAEENRQLHHEVTAANQALMELNDELKQSLAHKELQVRRNAIALDIAQEVMQYLPCPVIGIDNDNMIAFANLAADKLFIEHAPLLASNAAAALPPRLLEALKKDCATPACLDIGGTTYCLHREQMGSGSRSSGMLVVLLPGTAS
jgi:diguanylate cyclase (GGDEF)-like protein/PAS domain S-box-containing protein